MKSIKPGRGPSALGSAGSVFAAVFGLIWIFAAARMGAPGFFVLFGIVFIGMALVQAAYHFKNATGKNRYSTFDIVDDTEETDPLQERFGNTRSYHLNGETVYQTKPDSEATEKSGGFCPYCGHAVERNHRFCKNCGKEL